MSRRTWAGILAAVLIIAMSVWAGRMDVPYATFAPGPTVNVLGKYQDKEIISVTGHESHQDKGGLDLTTVVPSLPREEISIPQLMLAWINPDQAVYPYQAIYPTTATQTSVKQESTAQMVSSQDNAVAAALRALKIPFTAAVKVAEVTKGGPADGKLKPGDLLLAVNGKKATTVDQLTGLIRPLPIGSEITVKVRRAGRELEQKMRTAASPQDKKSSAVRVTIAPSYEFPFDVKLNIDQNIGGPSGGLVFAMGIYDVLTPGSLTDGATIAGTGEIDAKGRVGAIGGIQQKLVGAQNDGAKLFLVPADNCAEALDGHYDPDKMRLVKVSTLEDGIGDVKAWVADHDAKLTRCTR
jgi:Lon-like protease